MDLEFEGITQYTNYGYMIHYLDIPIEGIERERERGEGEDGRKRKGRR